jgi:3-oxoacyl-[acyl-carrier-protein] synthase II
MRRVVITGLGAISPHGLGAPALWEALAAGKSSLATLTRFDPAAFPSQVAGVVPAFKTTDFVPKSYRKATKIMARDIELAVVAADFAVRDARLATKGILETTPQDKLPADRGPWTRPDPARVGCNIGAGLICADLNELTSAMIVARNPDNSLNLAGWGKSEDPAKTSGMDNLTPLWLLKYLPNMLACHVSIIHDTQGPSNTITCGQASAGLALAEAARTIQRGAADLALVGGCETKLHPMGLMRWCLLNRLNTTSNDNPAAACRPYDSAAAGAVFAEGGAVLVIEEYEHAKARGATIYAEVAGLGCSASASANVVDPDPTGEAPAVAIKKALKEAAIAPDSVNLVIPPSYGIPAWDAADVRALQAALGQALARTAVLPARAGIGDCGAGAQALDLVAAALALHHQTLPPAVNCDHPIAGLAVSSARQAKNLDYAVILASALGGQNSAVVLGKCS